MAIPEVDIGDDLFVVNDRSGNYRRIQVKTKTAIRRKAARSIQFQVPLLQLEQTFTPDLIYVFASRFADGWGPFLVIPRDVLLSLHQINGLGSVVTSTTGKEQVQFYIIFGDDASVRCSEQSLAQFVNQFAELPDRLPTADFE